MRIEQGLCSNATPDGFRWLARSPGYADDWLAPTEAMCVGFGKRDEDTTRVDALFALPLSRRHVAVVTVSDQPTTTTFRVLVIPTQLYSDLGGDPFLFDDAFPTDWSARQTLPGLEWTSGPPPLRTVAELRRVLNVADERCAWLLGAAQVLVDGGRLVVERPTPDPSLIRDLWTLLPYSERAKLWPTTFAYGNANRFHVAIAPTVRADAYSDYVREDQAGDYPDGRYELALQIAVESEDERELQRLLTRRSRGEMVWIAVGLLVLIGLVALASRLPRLELPTFLG